MKHILKNNRKIILESSLGRKVREKKRKIKRNEQDIHERNESSCFRNMI